MTDARLPLLEAPVTAPLGHLLPPVTAQNAPFYDALREGRLVLQRCDACSRVRGLVAPVCPACGSESAHWEALSGKGVVHSWIRYSRSYLPELEPLLPYVVLCVELVEGARVFGRLREGRDGVREPETGMPVDAIVERWADGVAMFAFNRGERSEG
jgi:uncharacterized OB-fold protein